MDTPPLLADDVSRIERATSEAVPPERQRELGGWLLCFDSGSVGRARSAVPLAHTPHVGDQVLAIVEAYRREAGKPLLRVPVLQAFADARRRLEHEGFRSSQATTTMIASAERVADASVVPGANSMLASPTPAWERLFLAQGKDAQEAQSRLGVLRRARESVYVMRELEGEIVAVALACFAHGWCGVHGMRTAAPARRQGHARALLQSVAQESLQREIRRMFLQVESTNEAARALYRQAGFSDAWEYEYWA